ncbi:Hypothetical predicted protein [Scomber scombrus]|uniref:Uncharacterized protein n=1 Tax=Scomber scombrus TaxID=13677 RepID=A0AAV1MRS1_SCOSC
MTWELVQRKKAGSLFVSTVNVQGESKSYNFIFVKPTMTLLMRWNKFKPKFTKNMVISLKTNKVRGSKLFLPISTASPVHENMDTVKSHLIDGRPSEREKNRCVGSSKAAADCVCDVYRSRSCGRFTVNISFIALTGLRIYTGAPLLLPYTFGHPQSTGDP